MPRYTRKWEKSHFATRSWAWALSTMVPREAWRQEAIHCHKYPRPAWCCYWAAVALQQIDQSIKRGPENINDPVLYWHRMASTATGGSEVIRPIKHDKFIRHLPDAIRPLYLRWDHCKTSPVKLRQFKEEQGKSAGQFPGCNLFFRNRLRPTHVRVYLLI